MLKNSINFPRKPRYAGMETKIAMSNIIMNSNLMVFGKVFCGFFASPPAMLAYSRLVNTTQKTNKVLTI